MRATRLLIMPALGLALAAGLVAAEALAQQKAPAGKPITIAMAVTPPNLVHIPPYLARDLGYFKEEGLDVQIISFEGGIGSLRTVLANAADIALSSGNPIIISRAKGAPIRAIYSAAPRLEAALVVSGDIREPKDLKGRKIGIQEVGGFADILTKRVLLMHGIKFNEVQFISTSTAGRIPALLTGQVDTGIMHVEQAIRALKRKPSLRTLVRYWEAFPDWWYNGFAAHEQRLRGTPDVIAGALRAMIKANRFIYRNKEKALEFGTEYTGYTVEELEPTLDQFIKGKVFSVNDGLPERSLMFNVDQMIRVGNIPKDKRPTYDFLADRGPVNAALEKLGRWTDDPKWQ
ncbi:MAG: ABC transporter substrate-binding protein [Deltaproteobacteria bacterium]|nr:ABC transporter substrate-binding protein [Deltaproteobacteria bacterium]